MSVFKRSDFEFSYPANVRCCVPSLQFERPARLTKWDIACVLDDIDPHGCWLVMYNAFKRHELIDFMYKKLDNQ